MTSASAYKNRGFGFVVQSSTAEDPSLQKKLPCLKQRGAFRFESVQIFNFISK